MSSSSAPAPLRVGLVLLGSPPPGMPASEGGYLAMFGALLAPHGIELTGIDATGGPITVAPEDFDGYVLTGSASSVYDDVPWIAPAEDFVRAVVDRGIPVAGICFGHQLLAQALGGKVEKAPVGWGMGVHAYDLELDGGPTTMRLQAMHQDQVVALPDGARVWARSEHCPIAGFTVGDRVWTVQAHPEFTAPFAGALVDRRRALVGDQLADAAAATLDDPTDHELVAIWIADVLARKVQ
ncbi:MAG TPA: type 1 glutamine amidotransferase [Iamia sp.]|nr:type 1 glutamine amidotransferase [Iamia sp.]